MADREPDVAHWLSRARAGSKEDLGQVLEACRGYLLHIARGAVDPKLQAKAGSSDLLQETLLDACRNFDHFKGDSEEELLAWLRRLLLNRVSNFSRRYRHTAKRRAAAEVNLRNATSSSDGAGAMPDGGASPSELAIQGEESAALQRALDVLPEHYRQVLWLRYQEERSFAEIGQLMKRSANAAEKLWARAVVRLQQELEKTS
jgi:RNA polymerase sigma-70 factor (ECF subfamily)